MASGIDRNPATTAAYAARRRRWTLTFLSTNVSMLMGRAIPLERLIRLQLLDAGDSARDFDRFRTRQGFQVTIGQGDEAAAGAEFHGFAGGQRQFGLAAAFGYDERAGLRVLVDRAGGVGRTARGEQDNGSDERLPHVQYRCSHRLCCISQGIFALCMRTYMRWKLNRN